MMIPSAQLGLELDPATGVLRSAKGWSGMRHGREISVRHGTESYEFQDGLLRGSKVNGVETHYAGVVPEPTYTADALWPEKKSRQMEKNSVGDIWQSSARLRLWYANPNALGFLGAEIALIGLCLVACAKFFVPYRCHGLLLLLLGAELLIFAGSRGAMFAFMVGIAMIFASTRSFAFKRLLVFAAPILILLGIVIFFTDVGARFTDAMNHVDNGNALRLKFASATAQMFANGPWGWLGGDLPDRAACLNWFVLDEAHGIRTHLLTIAGLGWGLGLGYLAFWTCCTSVGFRLARCGSPCYGALMSAFFVAGFFNPVYREWTLWILPACALVWSVKTSHAGDWRLRDFGYGVAGAAVLLAMFGGAGWCLLPKDRVPVRSEGAITVVGRGEPTYWVVEDAPVLGRWNGFPGREIMHQFRSNPDLPTLGYVRDIADLPDEVDNLVLPGQAARDYLAALGKGQKVCAAKKMLFLSPEADPEFVPARLLARTEVRWYAGWFLARFYPGYRTARKWVRLVRGAEQYIPGWMERVNQFCVNKNNNKEH